MRHFAQALREDGTEVVVEQADTPAEGLGRHAGLVCAAPNGAPARALLERHGVRIVPSAQFLTDPAPWAATTWFRGSSIDGAEWVMAPNTIGMATWADGGRMMTKPYAAGGNHVSKMSTYCGAREHTPRDCPVTALYGDFIARDEERLRGNRRMRMALDGLRRLDPERLAHLREEADATRARL